MDEHLAAALPDRSAARQRLGLDSEQPIALYAGGLLRWKGVDVLVDAARDPRLAGALVLVVGGMDRDVAPACPRSRREQRAGRWPACGGHPLYLAAADVGVVPNRATPRISSHYTSPLKVFEALACGLPLVVVISPASATCSTTGPRPSWRPRTPGRSRAGSRLFWTIRGCARARGRGRQRVERATWTARARRVLAQLGSAQEVPA